MLDGTIDHYYRLQLVQGQQVTLSTSTPGDQTGIFSNALDPAIELYDPNDVLVDSDDNSGGDGRNAEIVYIPLESGTFSVRVRAAASQGEFVLSATGAATRRRHCGLYRSPT